MQHLQQTTPPAAIDTDNPDQSPNGIAATPLLATAGSFDAVAPYYEDLMNSVPYDFWLKYLERLWSRHRIPNQRVLDLACGTGTVSRMLAIRGKDVVGVDLASRMLEVARQKASEDRLEIAFIEQDAADLAVTGPPFDCIISLFDSLNYILDPDRLRQACRRAFEHLVPGGAFVFDVNAEYAFLHGMFNQSCTRRDEPIHYRWRSHYNQMTRVCTVNMTFSTIEDGVRREFKEVHRQRAYTKSEITAFLSDAGFAPITVYGAYTVEPPTPEADRFFYVAIKPHR